MKKSFWKVFIPAFLLLLVVGILFRPEPPLPDRVRIDHMVVVKNKRQLIVYQNDRAIKTYRISLGSDPHGPKEKKGDGKTPEGRYHIVGRNANSKYFRSLRIGYPSAADRARARSKGVHPGGDIMIHGLPNGRAWIGRWHRFYDWTQGCIAVTNEEMEELWRATPVGTVIRIEP